MNRIAISLAALLGAAWPLLIDSALKGAALLILASVAALALARASAATRHLIWLFALGGLLVLPVLTALLPGWRVLPQWTAVVTPAMSFVKIVAPPATLVARSPAAATAPTPDPVFALPQIEPEKSLTLRDWLVLAWAAGFVLLVARLLASYLLLLRAARRCVTSPDRRLARLIDEARIQLGIQQPVEVVLDPRRTIPMVWGLFRPRVVLPAEAVDWGESQLYSVLLHELAHVKRRDLAAQWLMQAACALYWFNPLVWFAAWRLHVEGERACDNLVLDCGVRASEYAEHVLQVATKLTPAGGTQIAALAMARPSRLEGRLLAVLNKRLNRGGATRVLALAASAIGLCVIIPVAMLRAADEKGAMPANDVSVAENAATPSGTETVRVELANDRSFSLQGKVMTLDVLTNELKRLRRTNPQVKVVVDASPAVAYANVVKVLDALEQNGVGSASIGTQKWDLAEVSRLRLAQAEKELDHAAELRRQKLIGEAEYDEIRHNVELRRAEPEVIIVRLRRAEAELERLTKLYAQNIVSAHQLDQARGSVELLKAELADASAQTAAQVQVATANLALAQANLKRVAELFEKELAARAELEVAQAEVSKAEMQLRLAKAQYEKLAVPNGNAAGLPTPQPGPPQALPASTPLPSPPTENPRPSQVKKERLLQILAEEIQVAEDQAKVARNQHAAGAATLETFMRAELDVLALKREAAHLEGNVKQEKDLIREQIRRMEDLQKTTREQRQAGVATEADELKVRREILSLKRQEAELE